MSVLTLPKTEKFLEQIGLKSIIFDPNTLNMASTTIKFPMKISGILELFWEFPENFQSHLMYHFLLAQTLHVWLDSPRLMTLKTVLRW